MTEDKRYWELAAKWLDGTITEREKAEFAAWYNAQDDEQLPIPVSFADDESALRDRILAKVKQRLVHAEIRPHRRLLNARIVAIAASLLLLTSVGLLLWYQSTGEEDTVQIAQYDVQPGTNKATLQLGNGRTLSLNESQREIILDGDIRYGDGTAVFEDDADDVESEFHTLSVPRGGEYQLTLPDGSKVWLNAASALRYPAVFSSTNREVELLYGEAYFEVKHVNHPLSAEKRIPFVVKTRDQQIEVLGTQFNVNAYEDSKDQQIQTTLVEGSVRIHHPSQGSIALTPGNQATYTAQGVSIKQVDTEVFTAWKDGYFYFNDADIYTILNQLSKWYDIDVYYDLTNPDGLYVGKIPRTASLSTALRVLKATGINFELQEGGKLYVKPKK